MAGRPGSVAAAQPWRKGSAPAAEHSRPHRRELAAAARQPPAVLAPPLVVPPWLAPERRSHPAGSQTRPAGQVICHSTPHWAAQWAEEWSGRHWAQAAQWSRRQTGRVKRWAMTDPTTAPPPTSAGRSSDRQSARSRCAPAQPCRAAGGSPARWRGSDMAGSPPAAAAAAAQSRLLRGDETSRPGSARNSRPAIRPHPRSRSPGQRAALLEAIHGAD